MNFHKILFELREIGLSKNYAQKIKFLMKVRNFVRILLKILQNFAGTVYRKFSQKKNLFSTEVRNFFLNLSKLLDKFGSNFVKMVYRKFSWKCAKFSFSIPIFEFRWQFFLRVKNWDGTYDLIITGENKEAVDRVEAFVTSLFLYSKYADISR